MKMKISRILTVLLIALTTIIAVKYNGKRYYSAWSRARSVKTKK